MKGADRDTRTGSTGAAVLEDRAMAKGQVRSNKETRKPKADKKAKAETTPMTVPGKFAAPQKESKK